MREQQAARQPPVVAQTGNYYGKPVPGAGPAPSLSDSGRNGNFQVDQGLIDAFNARRDKTMGGSFQDFHPTFRPQVNPASDPNAFGDARAKSLAPPTAAEVEYGNQRAAQLKLTKPGAAQPVPPPASGPPRLGVAATPVGGVAARATPPVLPNFPRDVFAPPPVQERPPLAAGPGWMRQTKFPGLADVPFAAAPGAAPAAAPVPLTPWNAPPPAPDPVPPPAAGPPVVVPRAVAAPAVNVRPPSGPPSVLPQAAARLAARNAIQGPTGNGIGTATFHTAEMQKAQAAGDHALAAVHASVLDAINTRNGRFALDRYTNGMSQYHANKGVAANAAMADEKSKMPLDARIAAEDPNATLSEKLAAVNAAKPKAPPVNGGPPVVATQRPAAVHGIRDLTNPVNGSVPDLATILGDTGTATTPQEVWDRAHARGHTQNTFADPNSNASQAFVAALQAHLGVDGPRVLAESAKPAVVGDLPYSTQYFSSNEVIKKELEKRNALMQFLQQAGIQPQVTPQNSGSWVNPMLPYLGLSRPLGR